VFIMMQVFITQLRNYAAQPEYRDSIGPLGVALLDLNAQMGGLLFIFLTIGMLSWIGVARYTRGLALAYKQKEFVEAARAVGARNRRIIFIHLLPNLVGPLIVIGALSVPGFIEAETILSFLGVGVQPPTASWGQIINFAYENNFQSHPEWVIGPGLMLSLTLLAFTFMGDGLRDALDPRLRGEK
jgi:oligopeptide transport system permease protein